MSTDFIALFDISSEQVTAEWLLAKVSANPGFCAEVVEHFRDYWQPKSWTIASPPEGQPEILGPGGFVIRIGPQRIDLYHMIPFRTFVGDTMWREALRRVCFSIANLVGSTRVIYTHELMPYEGQGLVEIERKLRQQIGPPASTFEELHEAEYFGPHAWYVDTFEDL